MKLLLDEMLSPSLVKRLGELGVPAQHIVYVGRAGLSDPQLWRYAFEHDQIVVTMNSGDFLALAKGSEFHAGLIVVRQVGLDRDEQWELLAPVVQELKDDDLMSKVVEIYGNGRFEVRSLPAL